VFFRCLWRTAGSSNALFAQLLYMQSCTCAMRALTHWTLDFLPGLLYNLIFIGAAVLYASSRKSPQSDRDRALHAPAKSGCKAPYFPKALATMKISTAPPNPPPNIR
jgi:hypothetical protein